MNNYTKIRKAYRLFVNTGDHALMWEISKIASELGLTFLESKCIGNRTMLYGAADTWSDTVVLASVGEESDNVKSIW